MTEQRTCTIDGCERPREARGLCNAHYHQVRRGKTPGPIRQRRHDARGALVDRVLEIVHMEPTGECELWHRGGDDDRPIFKAQGKPASVTRTVLALTAGPPPTPEHQALHAPGICHEPRCVAPWHLRWGTPAENAADMWLDGTAGKKLTETDVRAIRSDPRTQRTIAAEYGIDRSTVSAIKLRKTWRHLPPT